MPRMFHDTIVNDRPGSTTATYPSDRARWAIPDAANGPTLSTNNPASSIRPQPRLGPLIRRFHRSGRAHDVGHIGLIGDHRRYGNLTPGQRSPDGSLPGAAPLAANAAVSPSARFEVLHTMGSTTKYSTEVQQYRHLSPSRRRQGQVQRLEKRAVQPTCANFGTNRTGFKSCHPRSKSGSSRIGEVDAHSWPTQTDSLLALVTRLS
jgi:hypothetical protein